MLMFYQVRYATRVESSVLVPIDLALATNQDEVDAYKARIAAQEQAAAATGVKVRKSVSLLVFLGRIDNACQQFVATEAPVLPKLDLLAALQQRFGVEVGTETNLRLDVMDVCADCRELVQSRHSSENQCPQVVKDGHVSEG